MIPSRAKGNPIHCVCHLRSFPCSCTNHAMAKGTQPAMADWIYVFIPANYLWSTISTENTSTGQSTYLKMDMPSTFSEIISGLNQFNPTNHPCDARRLAALLKHIQWAVVTSFVQFNSQKHTSLLFYVLYITFSRSTTQFCFNSWLLPEIKSEREVSIRPRAGSATTMLQRHRSIKDLLLILSAISQLDPD